MRHFWIAGVLLPSLLFLSTIANASSDSVRPVRVPVTAETQRPGPASSPRLNLNTADAAALQKTLHGIGKAKAQAIVAYREVHGPYVSVDELLEVKGIGSALLERNRSRISIR